jgi:signal transduction histidine kinase
MKLFGIDFPAAHSSEDPLRIAVAELKGKNEIIVQRIEILDSKEEFETFLNQEGPWFAGIDIPFGLPWSFWNHISVEDDWRSRIQALVQTDPDDLQRKAKKYQARGNHNPKDFLRVTEEVSSLDVPSVKQFLHSISNMIAGMPFLLNANLSLIPVNMSDSSKQIIETCPGLIADEIIELLEEFKESSTNQINFDKFFSNGGMHEKLESIFEFKISFDDQAITDIRTLFANGNMDCIFSLLQASWSAISGSPTYGFSGLDHPVAKIEGRFALPKLISRTREKINFLQDHDHYLLDQIKALSEIGQSLSGQLKLPVLLETIVKEARNLTRADGGTLYILENGVLEFKIVQNDSLSINMGCSHGDPLPFKPLEMCESNVSAFVAMQRTTVKIDDLQNSKEFDFTGPMEFDASYGYHTQSMLVVPMRDYQDEVIGVLQLLNSKNAKSNEVEPFSEHDQRLVESLASQAAIAISNAYLVADLQKANEDLIHARDKALDASRAKSHFLANMSHELRTPMNAVIGYSEMLIEDAVDQGLDDFESDLNKINTAGKHLLNLINQVLDLSKIESGKMEVYLEVFKLSDLIQEVIYTIQPLAEQGNNELIIECDGDLDTMKADVTKVRQILFNLLGNACKFTKNGKISLEITLFKTSTIPWIRYRVIDTGIGISPYDTRKLFSDFTQVDPSTTRKFGGTGLGLAICRRFSRMMGGDVTVSSKPDVGSTFTLELPMEVKPVDHPRRRFSDIT